MRPPQRSRASTMVTRLPARASSRAVMRPAAPAPTIRNFVGCVAKAEMVEDDAAADWSWSRSGRRILLRGGADRAYLAGGVLQFLVAELRRHVVLLGQREESSEPKRLF